MEERLVSWWVLQSPLLARSSRLLEEFFVLIIANFETATAATITTSCAYSHCLHSQIMVPFSRSPASEILALASLGSRDRGSPVSKRRYTLHWFIQANVHNNDHHQAWKRVSFYRRRRSPRAYEACLYCALSPLQRRGGVAPGGVRRSHPSTSTPDFPRRRRRQKEQTTQIKPPDEDMKTTPSTLVPCCALQAAAPRLTECNSLGPQSTPAFRRQLGRRHRQQEHKERLGPSNEDIRIIFFSHKLFGIESRWRCSVWRNVVISSVNINTMLWTSTIMTIAGAAKPIARWVAQCG